MLSFLLAVAEKGKCTAKLPIKTVNQDSLAELIGKGRNVVLRLKNNGCAASVASEESWRESSLLNPNIQFAELECLGNGKLCNEIGADFSPSHAFYAGDAKNVTDHLFIDVGGNPEFNQPSGFNYYIKSFFHYYPTDTPVFEQLFYFSTDKFFAKHEHPVFVLYDSTCQEDLDFLAEWQKTANEEDFDSELGIGFGRIDCSVNKDECSRWGKTIPSATVYSKVSNARATITEKENIGHLIRGKIKALDEAPKVITPYPRPVAPPPPPPKEETIEAELIQNLKLQNRNLEDVKNDYYNSMKITDQKARPAPGDINVEQCQEVTEVKEDIADAVKRINFFRRLAGLPDKVTNYEAKNRDCYLTARSFTKANFITHEPIDSNLQSNCGGQDIATIKNVAKHSNLGQNDPSLAVSVNKFMLDRGDNNKGAVGHRRWLLYPYLTKVALGYYPQSDVKKNPSYIVYRYLSVSVIQVKGEGDEWPKISLDDYTDNTFTAWPAPGPFPYDELPDSWSVYHPELAKEDTTLDNIKVKITRDDGTPIDVKNLYLDKTTKGLPGNLIIELSPLGLKLCQSCNTYHVQVYILKSKNLCIDYKFTLFDNRVRKEVCFYDSDKSKCPSGMDAFGKGQYNTFKPEFNSFVYVKVAETLKPTEPIKLDFSSNIVVSNGKIGGDVIIGSQTTCEIKDPTLTNVKVVFEGKDNQILCGKLLTRKTPKSVTICITGTPKYTEMARTLVFEGNVVPVELDKSTYYYGDYRYTYAISYQSDRIYVTSQANSNVDIFDVTEGDVTDIKDAKIIKEIKEIKNLLTKKDRVRLYLKDSIQQIWANQFPPELHDYEIIYVGKKEFRYDSKFNRFFRSITINPTRDNSKVDLEVFPSANEDPIYFNTKLVTFNNITINNFDYKDSKTVEYNILEPGLKGDANAKKVFQNEKYYKVFYDDVFDQNGAFSISLDKANSGVKTVVFRTDGSHSKYTIKKTSDQGNFAEYVIFMPIPGTENKEIEVEAQLYDQFFYIPIFMNYKSVKYTSSDNNLIQRGRFVNVSKSVLNPTSTPPSSKTYSIQTLDVYGEEADISSSDTFSRKIATLSIADNTNITATNTQATTVKVEGSKPVINNLKILTALKISDSNVQLNNCDLTGTITLTKGRDCPSVSYTGGKFNPSAITIDMNEGLAPRKALVGEETPFVKELYPVVLGLNKDNGDAIYNMVTVNNKGQFEKVLSTDKTTVYVTNADLQDKSNIPEGAPKGEVFTEEDTKIDEGYDPSKEPKPTPYPNTEGGNSQPENNGDDSTEDSTNKAAIIAVSVVVPLVVIGIAVGLTVFFLKRKKVGNDESMEDQDNENKENE